MATFEPGPVPGAVIHPLESPPHRLGRYGGALRDIRALVGRLQPDLVHAHYLTGYGYLSPWLGFRPWALTVWGSDVYRSARRSPLDRLLSRRALRSAGLVIGDSRDVVRAAEDLGARPERSVVIPWGVETDRFRRGATDRWRVLSGLGMPEDADVILSARSLDEEFYRVEDVVLGSLAAMADRPNAFLVVAGCGRLDESVRRLAKGHGAADRIRWVGQVPRGRMVELMNVADVYVTVPTHDATSVALLEALSSGAAVVASDLPSNREWIGEATGVIVPANSPDDVAREVADLLDDRERRRAMGRAGRSRVRTIADHRACMDRVDALVRALVE